MREHIIQPWSKGTKWCWKLFILSHWPKLPLLFACLDLWAFCVKFWHTFSRGKVSLNWHPYSSQSMFSKRISHFYICPMYFPITFTINRATKRRHLKNCWTCPILGLSRWWQNWGPRRNAFTNGGSCNWITWWYFTKQQTNPKGRWLFTKTQLK